MRILLIEDFGKQPRVEAYLQDVFGDLLPGDLLNKYWNDDQCNLKKTPVNLLNFFREHSPTHDEAVLCRYYPDFKQAKIDWHLVRDFDVVLIDINLSEGVDPNFPVPEGYRHDKGGFYIYNELLRLGFCEENICFLTAQEETLGSFITMCRDMSLPKPSHTFEKGEEGYRQLRGWLDQKQANDYLTLRRGIIEGCRLTLSRLSKEKVEDVIQFGEFLESPTPSPQQLLPDLRDYLTVLQDFLPLRQPDSKSSLYKLFIRTLSHEWEAARPDLVRKDKQLHAFGWIMKNVRNWSAHTDLFTCLGETEVAFLCLISLRTLFQWEPDKLFPFEKMLLSLFKPPPPTPEEMANWIVNKKLNLAKSYATLKRKVTSDREDAVTFSGMLNNLVNSDKISSSDLRSRLFQMFWHGLSKAKVQNAKDTEDQRGIKNAGVWYAFDLHNYGKEQPESFLFQIARHIYFDSQLE